MEGFTPEELAAVFRALQAAGWEAVLVGGQVVNLWAHRYERDLPAWHALRPYTSRDLDYHGGLAEARLAMRTAPPRPAEYRGGSKSKCRYPESSLARRS